MHNAPESTCIDGKTKTNLKILIQQEGLPTDIDDLRHLFISFHEQLGVTYNQIKADLETYGAHVRTKHISFLQRSRKEQQNYYRP
jgi:hypothetical protein